MNDQWEQFGQWLEKPDIPPQDKVAECFKLLDAARSGEVILIESMGKACAHSAYRLLDGTHSDVETVEKHLGWLRVQLLDDQLLMNEGHAVGGRCFQRARWFTSLTICSIYIMCQIRKDGTNAALRSLELNDMALLDAAPYSVVNMCRASMLRCTWYTRNGWTRHAADSVVACQRFFRYAAATAPFQHICNGEELAQAARMVKLAIAMYPRCGMKAYGHPYDDAALVDIETSQPFAESLRFMLGVQSHTSDI